MSTFVLLRGLVREAGHWGDVAELLQRELPAGEAVIALDLPGNGARHRMKSAATVAGLLAACRSDLRQRGAAPPFVLVAMSLGAMVALQWCEEAPGELAGCVLVNTSLRGVSPAWLRLKPRNWLRLAGLLAPGLSPLRRERLVLAMTSSDAPAHAAVPRRWAAIAAARPVRRTNAIRQLLAALRYAAPARPGVPLLVLASARDTLVDPRCSIQLARLWQLPVALHPQAGHDLPLDAPQWFVASVARWWRALADRHESANGLP